MKMFAILDKSFDWPSLLHEKEHSGWGVAWEDSISIILVVENGTLAQWIRDNPDKGEILPPLWAGQQHAPARLVAKTQKTGNLHTTVGDHLRTLAIHDDMLGSQ